MSLRGASWSAAEAAARTSYGRLLATLARQWRDLGAAEDALAEAFVAALAHWPEHGVPAQPDAWLLTAARRNLQQRWRHAEVVDRHADALQSLENTDVLEAGPAVDERLQLLFVCAHPALPEDIRAPLMLQTVLGLEVRTIADAFLLAPTTLAQRLVRAKQKIRLAGIRFELPQPDEFTSRLEAVLDAVYACYSIGSNVARHAVQEDAGGLFSELTQEALYLAGLLMALLPREPEAAGLYALALYCEARRPAQFDEQGNFVPLAQQTCARWQRPLLLQAEQALRHAAALQRSGPYQLEAAIQSAHCQRAFGRAAPAQAIATLYDHLAAMAPGIGVEVARAAAWAEAGQPAAALALLDALPSQQVATYQPWWVVRAHLLRRLGERAPAARAQAMALGLTADPRIRAWLADQSASEAGD